MKKKLVTASLVLLLSASAFTVIDSIFERIGLEEKAAREHVMGNLLGSFNDRYTYTIGEDFVLPRVKMLPALLTGDKAGAARELCTWVKEYVKSPEFRETYNRRREQLRPNTNMEGARPDEETIQMTRESIRETEKQLAELRKQKGVPAASIKSVEEMLAGMKQNLAAWNGDTPEKMKWEKNLPADPMPLLRQRLEQYLALAATVDFNAALETDRYNRKKFVNPEYEKKSNQWKAIYRAGKEVNDVVTVFVKDWLKTDFAATASATPSSAKPPLKPAAPKPAKPATQAKGRNPRTGK